MRADARRNAAAILDAATRALVDDPTASMSEVAADAGLNRATLYRHFPTRDDLVRAIHDRALTEAAEAIAAGRPEEGPAADALRRAAHAVIEVAGRYRSLIHEAAHKDPCLRERELEVSGPLIALVRRAQADGTLRDDQPAEWVLESFFSLVLGALGMVDEGALAMDDVERLVTGTWLEGALRR